MKDLDRNGVTLMELMIVVIIMAVVAGLAIPSYRQSVERARANEATTNLFIIFTAEKLYKLDNSKYIGGLGCVSTGNPTTCTAINTPLNVDITAQFYNLSIGAASAVAYTATASRVGATKTYAIDQTGTITSGGVF